MDRLSSLWSTVNSCSRMVFREYWCPHTIHHLMVWQKGSSRLSSMLWSFLWLILPDPACTPQQQITRFLLSYRSTPHATTGSSPARLFLGRDLSTCLSLTRPDLASCVACQQGKMKSNHDKHAKFQDVAVGDTWHCWHCWHVTIYPVASGNLVQWYSRLHPIPTVFSNKMVRLGGDTSMTFFWTVQVQEPLKQRKHPLREIFKITLEKQTAPLQKIVNQRIHPLLLPLLVLNYANLNAPQNHLRGWLKNFEWTLLCSFEHC